MSRFKSEACRGTANAEIRVSSAENVELSKVPFARRQARSRSVGLALLHLPEGISAFAISSLPSH